MAAPAPVIPAAAISTSAKFLEYIKKITPSSVTSTVKPQIPLIGLLIFISVVLYYAITDPQSLVSRNYTYAMIIIFAVAGTFAYIAQSKGTSKFNITESLAKMSRPQMFGLGAFMLLCFIGVSMYQYAKGPIVIFIGYVFYAIFFLSLMVGLAIIYNVFMNYFLKQEGIAGFITNFIFFIPCLINDFIELAKSEFKIATNTVFILFSVEILLVLGWLYLPSLVKYIAMKPGIRYLNTPVFLTSSTHVADGNFIPNKPGYITTIGTLSPGNIVVSNANIVELGSETREPTNGVEIKQFYRNYAVSMWISINPATNTKDTEYVIFNYGNYPTNKDKPDLTNSKPAITYYVDKDTSESMFFIYFTKSFSDVDSTRTDTISRTDFTVASDLSYNCLRFTGVPLQRWNQFIINYNNNRVDVFINGVLKQTFDYAVNAQQYNNVDPKSVYPKYGIGDTITVGQKNGVNGAICNLNYFNQPLTTVEIVNSFNLNQFQNPPLF